MSIKLFIASFVLLLVSVFSPLMSHAVLAYNPLEKACTGSASGSSACTTNTTDPVSGTNGIIYKVTQLVVIVTAIASVIMIIVGGYTYVMSMGDPQRISAAKNTILYAVIGLIIAISAQLIIQFVLQNVI